MATRSLNSYKVKRKYPHMQHIVSPQRIVFTKQQVEDIQTFKADLQEGNVEIAFEGSLLEGITFLEGVKKIVESCSH